MASDWTDLQSSNPADVGHGGTNVDVGTLAGTSAAQSLPSVENLLESNLLFGSAETFGPGVSTFMTAASAGDTFSGTADHPIAVKVSGSSNGSADLSTQAESKAASAQLVTDPAVQSTSATSNAVSLATDSSLQPSLSVDAANPAHVTFTVSGLEPDYSGTVTFTDPSGTQDVVPIESNGAYSANLSNLTNGTITYLLSVSDPAGNVITVDPPLNFGDGSANAPAGTPQLPNLLSGYAATPSWNVAGVNYYVGDPAGTTLKNPDTINMAGVTVDTSTDVVTITGNNITLSGYDFSLNGGWQVYVAGNNDTIEDCNFEVGSNGQAPISIGVNGQTASNTTIEYNTINGNGISVGGGGLIECSGIGTTTIEYNSITNAYNEAIVLGNTTSSAANYVVQYNLIENTGLGYTEGAHGDWIQTFNAPGDTSSIEINYNTFVQNVAGQSTQGLSLQSANITQGPVLSETVENNTMVALDSGTVNYAIIVDTTNLNGSATVANNYIGPTGLTYGWSFFGQYNNPDGSYNGTLTSFNNVDMATGAYYPQSGTSVTKVVSSPSTGNEVPGNTITLTLDFSSPVTVTGTPTLTLNDGGTATYKSGSGTSALTFNYTVGSSDSTESNLAITAVNLPDGATINSGGTAANLTNALTTLWGLTIDPPSGPTLNSITESPSSDDLVAGNTVTLTLNLSENATVNTAGGTPTLMLNDGGTATFTGGSGTNALTFSYTVSASNSDTASLAVTAVNLNGATVQDGSGNAANFSLIGLTQTGPDIDTTAPTISSAVESPAGGDLDAGKVVTLTINLSENVTVNTAGGIPTLTLNDGGTATYTSGSGTSGLVFSYTVAAGQNTANLTATAINLNGATIQDGAGYTANLSLTGLIQTGPQIDTTAPNAPVIASDTVNANVVTLTGTAEANSTVTVFDNSTELGTAAANSSGAWTFTTGALANGSQSFTATATDASGNVSAASSALAVSVSAPINLVTNGNFATDSFSGWTLGGNYTSTTYGSEIFIDTNAEGSSTYAAGMGSVGSDGTLSQTLQTTAGQQYTLSFWLQNEGGTPNNFTATWNGTPLLALTSATQSGYTEYTYTVTATGSTSTLEFSAMQGPSQWDLDNISVTPVGTVTPPPPAAPVISTGVANSNESVTLTGTAPDGSTVAVSDGGATALGTATASSTGAWSFTTADLSAGSYAFTATGTTSAGTSAASSAFDVTVTPPPPAAPVISTGVANSNESVTLTGTAPDGSTVAVSDGGATALGTATASSTGAWSFTTADLPAGSYAFTATDTTSAGTSAASSAFDVTVTPPPPAAPVISTGVANSNESVTLTGTAPDGSTVTVSDGGTTALGTATASSTGAWSFTTADLSAGSYAFTATDTTSAGTSAASSAFDVTVTPPPPDPPTVSAIAESPSSGDLDAGKTVTYTIDMSEPVTVNTAGGSPTLALNDGGTAIYTSGSGTKALTFVYTVAAGQNTPDLQVTEINLNGGTISDGAGNAANLSLTGLTQGSPQIDTTAPNAPVISSDTINTDVVTLTGSAEANSTVTVYNGTAELGTAAANSSGAWSYTTGTLASGNYAFTAKATDAAGNVSTASSAVDVTVNTPANLVTNGGFETGNLSGWTLGGNSTSTTYGPEIFITPDAESGQDAAALGSVNSDGTLSQTLQTTAGQQYTLSFWLANEGSGPNNFTVYWNGTAVTTLTNAPAQNYTEYSFTVTATGSTSTLEFAAEQNPSQWDLDNVSVTPVGTMTPAITAIGESPSSGDLNAGKTGTITLDLNEAVTVAGGTPTLTLNDGGTATYTSGSGTDALTFSYTVGAGQNTADLAATAVNLNGATIKDGATAANLSLTGLTQAGPQIDTVAPPPPVISTDQKNGVRTVALTGTAEADSTVTVYDNGKDLGTTTANASGAWSFTTGRLARGSQVFTATDTDAAGNTSAPSNPIDPIIGGAAPQNAAHNAAISVLSSYIASSFPEASVSQIVADALQAGNQSLLTNPHHA